MLNTEQFTRYIKYDFCLIAVSGTAVYFGSLLTVTAEKKQSDRSGKFTLAVLFRNFNEGGIKLSIAVCF